MTLVREYQPTFVLGDGETKEFSYLFEEVSKNFVKVIVKHSDNSTYIPVFTVDLDSHKVIFGISEIAPSDTDVVCIYRETPDLQDTPFRTLQGYDAKALENILSKIVAMVQEIKSNGFSTQILQGAPWQLDLIQPADDNASVVIDYDARILKKGLYFQIVSGNLQVSADGISFITMPKSSDITEFRRLETVLEDFTIQYRLQYKVNGVWYNAESNAEATADAALQVAEDARDIANDAKDIAQDAKDQVDDLQDEVDALKGLGRFLSVWNCATGLAETNPPESPYTYKSGDYFLVGVVSSATPAVNYKPDGATYTTGVASTTVESDTVKVNDVYIYDGTNWKLQANSQRDVVFSAIQGSPYDNTALSNALGSKQDTLVNQNNIKSINGISLLGSGNLELSTYLTYPVGWTTNSTTKAFCDDIAADASAVKGKAYLGDVTFSDLPASMANAEIIAKIMDGTTALDKVIVLTCTSGNISPYMWQYTYWNNGSNVSGWQTWATSAQGALAESAIQQVSTMPTASVSNVGDIVQFIGATDANYTNGYFYKSTENSGVYSWIQTDVQPQASGLPSQTGNAGKFLTTDGTDASWSDKPLVNQADSSLSPYKTLFINAIDASDSHAQHSVVIGGNATGVGNGFTYIGDGAGRSSWANCSWSVGIGYGAQTTGAGTIMIGSGQNLNPGTFAVALGAPGVTHKVYEVVSADGTVPTDRLKNAINKYSTMPTAASTNEGWIVQFIGTTDANYTHGYIYECKAQGTTPETYAWEAVEVQAGGGLPSQSGNAGKFLTTDGTDASWSDKPLVNQSTGTDSIGIGAVTSSQDSVNLGIGTQVSSQCVAIGKNAKATWGGGVSVGCNIGNSGAVVIGKDNTISGMAFGVGTVIGMGNTSQGGIIIGHDCTDNGQGRITIGNCAKSTASNAIQIGFGSSSHPVENNEANTFKVGFSQANNYKLLGSDGTIPAARHADTTSATQGQILTLDSNLKPIWAAGGGAGDIDCGTM